MNPVKFVIAGAAKSGTTSLYQYINRHNDVFMPQNKEPRYFCNYQTEKFDFGNKYFHSDIAKTKEQYEALFDSAPAGSLCGEASTDYLACDGTAQRILNWDKDIKIIIMLRNPVERAYSEYMHSYNAKFQRLSFWNSLQKEQERKEKLYDPIFFHVSRSLYAKAVNDFSQKLKTKIILFEDFSANPQEVTQSTLEFLGLKKQSIDTATAFNVGTKSYYDSQPLSTEQHVWLVEQFRKDVEDLEEQLGRNLQHWLT
jgi:hypothetical protein